MNPNDRKDLDNCHEGLENLLLKGLKDDIDDDMLSFQSGSVYMGLDNEETPSFLDDKIQRNDRKSLTHKHIADIEQIQAILNKNNVIKPPLNSIPERQTRSDKKWKTMKYNNIPLKNSEGLESIEEYDFENNYFNDNQNINNMYLSTNITNNSNNNSSMFNNK